METWKPIAGYERLYEISNSGNVRRLARGKKLTPEKVEIARKMIANGATLHAIGAAIGVSYGTAFQIRKGITWNGDAKYRMIAPYVGTDFYLYYWLCKDGKSRRYSAHRLLWIAFNGEIPPRIQINHKNLDRADNRLENLELMTVQENIDHAIEHYKKTQGTHQTGGKYYAQKLARRLKKQKAL